MADRFGQQAYSRLKKALRPWTTTVYASKFKLYLAFTSWYQFQVDEVGYVLAFLEFFLECKQTNISIGILCLS